jgi:hypothetical protein
VRMLCHTIKSLLSGAFGKLASVPVRPVLYVWEES